jgi:hypothetical protein
LTHKPPDIYFRTALDAVKAQDNVLVILPYFSPHQLWGSQWGKKHHGYYSASLHWNTSGWMKGSNASPLPYRFSSSFDIMDDLLRHLSSSQLFPALSHITIAGYSAGSQYASRYAWATGYNITVDNPKIQLEYLLSGSSSFLYLSPHRPAPSCREGYRLGLDNDCLSFEIPSAEEQALCPHYDLWKYGLSFPSEGYNYLLRYLNDSQVTPLSSASLCLSISISLCL